MAQGMIYTFGDTVTVKRTVSNIIHNIDPQDIMCQAYFGVANQGKFALHNLPNHKYEWLIDTSRVRTDAINDGTNISDSDTDIVVDDASKFKPYDVVEIGTEYILVTTVDTTTNTLGGCSRGFAGTTAAAHNDNAVVTYKFSARLEGQDNSNYPYTVPTSPYNYSQIMHASINVSNSEREATTRYGMTDKYKQELMKILGGKGGGGGRYGRAGDLPLDLEGTFFGDQGRVQRTATVPGVMGGYKYFVTTNALAAASARLDLDMLLERVGLCWDRGGKPTTIICNRFQKKLINSWFEDSIRTERSESTGGVVINRIETDFGPMDVMLHRHCPADEVYIVDRDTVGWVTLRDWEVHPLGITGDGKTDEVVGEFGFVVTTEFANAVITGLATS